MGWTRPAAGLAALVMLSGVAAAAPNLPARGNVGCEQGQVQPTTLSIEGNLYADVRGEHNRYAFGGSGPYVLSSQEALVLVRKLGFKGTNAQLVRRLSQSTIPGVDFGGSGGSSSDFTFTCRGSYRVTALVRREGHAITGTRFWLKQGRLRITRAFCMPEQWVPADALVSVSFRVPLARTPPEFEIDWDGDHKVDSIGPFRSGGARFPNTERCE
jgi:hypothetical protein